MYSDRVDKPGKYNNFTGTIFLLNTFCEVRNATFEILKNTQRFKNKLNIEIIFKSGDIVSGELWGAIIDKCNFSGRTVAHSVFRSGIFKGNIFYHSYWYGGEWSGKDWDHSFDKFGRERSFPPTEWLENTKKTGVANQKGNYSNFTGQVEWKKSNFEVKNADFELSEKGIYRSLFNSDILFQNGIIVDGYINRTIIKHCEFQDGVAEEVYWEDGIWHKGTMRFDAFQRNTSWWVDGTWKGGTWEGGIWWDGVWERGIWVDGSWNGGAWLGGTWKRGKDKEGNVLGEGMSPNTWTHI